MRTMLPLKVFCFVIASCFSFVVVPEIIAQTQPCDDLNSPPVNKKGWPQGAEVPVWIDPAIVGQRREKVWAAFELWTAANRLNHSYVKYVLASNPPPNGTGYVVFDDHLPNDQGGDCPQGGCIVRGETHPDFDANGNTAAATTYLDDRVTDPEAVLELMSHEIGHPAGFGDCDYCLDDESVMAPTPIGSSLNDYNATGRVAAPSPCDNQRLQTVNYPCNRPSNCQNWDPDNCVCLAYDLYDSGSGSGEDCTDWYWVEYVNFGGTWIATGWTAYAGCWGKSGNTF